MHDPMTGNYKCAYYAANRDAIRAKQAAYRERHRDRLRKRQRERYAANSERARQAANEYRRKNPELVKARKRKTAYGITSEHYNYLMQEQKGLCAICLQPPKGRGLHVDHDHATGAIRGLLCNSCNNGLGRFRDDPDLLNKAADYLKTGGVR